MADNDFNPSQSAHDMQLRTRKAKNFDEVEAKLPGTTKKAHQESVISKVITEVGSLLHKGQPVGKGDVVWLLDNTAFQDPSSSSSSGAAWRAEFVAAVFESDPHCKTADVVAGIAKQVGLADDAAEKKTIEQRIMPFLWGVEERKTVEVQARDRELKLRPTNVNGITSEVLDVSDGAQGSFATASATVPDGVGGVLNMQTYYAGPEGWGIISDIDDTIKITMTSDPTGILTKTFVDSPQAVPGMPELYSQIKSTLPEDTPFFYLSASPYNLYPFLKDFRSQFYPGGTMILRDSSWRTISGLLSNLTLGTEEYKVDRMKKINSWLPKRKMIAFGDSTQSDPEAYGEIYRKYPGWIRTVFIRKATDIAELGLAEKNEPARFEKAFKGVPTDAWHVFEDPKEVSEILQKMFAAEGQS